MSVRGSGQPIDPVTGCVLPHCYCSQRAGAAERRVQAKLVAIRELATRKKRYAAKTRGLPEIFAEDILAILDGGES